VTLPRFNTVNPLILVLLALWTVQPFTAGELLGDALNPTRSGFQSTLTVAAWALWAMILIAIAVARPVTLTISRVGIAGGLVAVIWAAIDLSRRSDTVPAATLTLAMVTMIAAVVCANLPGVADRFLNGVSYGTEERYALRPPGPVLIVLVVPATGLALVGMTAGPLLLADQQWLAGAVVSAVGLPLAAIALNALHRLGNRFLVFVPNGLVIHDLSALSEPVLFVHREMASLGPARLGTDATDITAAALGLVLELRLDQPIELPLVTGRRHREMQAVSSLLIAPSRPSRVLNTAVERGMTIA